MAGTVLRGVGRFVGWWLGRAVLAAFAVASLGTAPHDTSEGLLAFASWILGVAFAGGFVATFRPLFKPGMVVAGLGTWGLFTWYGLVAFLDPYDVVSDTQRSSRGPEVDTPTGAYLLGAFVLLLANGPVLAVLWSLRPRRTRPAPVTQGPSAEHDWVLERRQRSKRRRKRRLKR